MDDEILGAGGRSRGDTSGAEAKLRGRARPAPVLLALVLIATLCPLVPASPAAAAGTIIELPTEFYPSHVNNNDQVAGVYSVTGERGIAIWTDGELERIPLSDYISVVDFNDAGEVLVSLQSGELAVVTTENIRVLPKPIIDEAEGRVYSGWGPDAQGRVVGKVRWAPEGSAVVYQGGGPPTLITQLSTVFSANDAGQVFGMLHTTFQEGAKFAMLQNGVVREVTGIGPFAFPGDLSDGGHLLVFETDGYKIWKDGRSEALPQGSDFKVNRDGVVAFVDSSGAASIRAADGRVRTLSAYIGGHPEWTTLHSVEDMNDRCSVLGQGQRDGLGVTGPTANRFFLATIDDCMPVDIEGSFFRVDGGSPFVKVGDDADVRLRVQNVSSSELTNVKIDSAEVVVDDTEGAGAAELSRAPTLSSTTLATGGPASMAFADFRLVGTEAGAVTLRAKVSASKQGETVTGTIEREFEVRQDDLVVNLTLNPPDYEESEDGTFEPVDITATVSFTNATNEDMTNLRLQDLDVARTFTGQELYVTYKSGIRPDPLDPEVIVPLLEPGQTSAEFQAVFTATDDGEVEFSALATAANGANGGATGVAKVRWKAKVKKFVEITTEVESPPDDELLDAGGQIIINGTVENLTNNYDITLGPLYPSLLGNTGTMNVGYDGPAANPTAPQPAEPMTLEPGQTRTFQVRIRTNYSDPAMYEARPSGGTRAYVTFEPWGEAVERQDPNAEGPPERVDIRTYDEASSGNGQQVGEVPDAQVQADPGALFKRISIDDSIELPERDPIAIGAGIMKGAVEGLANAAIAAIYAIPDILKMPYTILVAAYDYQAKVWDSFTEAEKDQFLSETSFLIVSVLQRNVEFGLRDGAELYDEVYELAGDHLTKTQNDWYTGDYLATTEGYSAFLSEQIGSVAGPVILAKLAQSPKAVAALERLQVAINTKMATTFAAAKNVRYVDNVLPILQSIENGAEPTLTAIAKLWGVAPDEVAEYQRICGVIGCIANIRSRHASSIEWVKKWGALLKPENLKIKTVNELDVMLGYRFDDLGSVVFRKPEILKTLGAGASKSAIKAEAARFAASKGFKAGTKEFTEAVTRLEDRASEWNKYQKTYQQWNERGWIDTSFNYEGNAIPEYRYDASGNVVGKLTGGEKGNFKGFRMVETESGSDEFIVQMLDGKTGKWRRITGDIDPVDFTYTDGSPLSPEDHARLINMLQNSPLGAEHGYTATFAGFKDPKTGQVIVKPGPELVKKQFKPNEPALQIAPGANPRAARLDVENSRWVDPYDYNLRWINGFVDAGTGRGRGPAGGTDALTDVVPLDAPAQIALPVKTKPPEPTVGRFIVKNGNKGDTAALMMGANGILQNVLPDGTTKDSPLHGQAFSEGSTETITIAPVSKLVGDTAPNPAPFDLFGFGGADSPARAVGLSRAAAVADVASDAVRLSAASLDAGSTAVRVSTSSGLADGGTGFAAGQQLAIGVGTESMEVRTVSAVSDDGLITLTEALEFDHAADEVVVMVVSAAGVPVDPTKGVDPRPVQGTGGGGTGTGSGAGNGTQAGSDAGSVDGTGAGSTAGAGSSDAPDGVGSSSQGAPLAYTGSNLLLAFVFALALIVLGVLMRRRRHDGRAF